MKGNQGFFRCVSRRVGASGAVRKRMCGSKDMAVPVASIGGQAMYWHRWRRMRRWTGAHGILFQLYYENIGCCSKEQPAGYGFSSAGMTMGGRCFSGYVPGQCQYCRDGSVIVELAVTSVPTRQQKLSYFNLPKQFRFQVNLVRRQSARHRLTTDRHQAVFPKRPRRTVGSS